MVHLFKFVFLFSLGKYPEVELLECMIQIFLIFWGTLAPGLTHKSLTWLMCLWAKYRLSGLDHMTIFPTVHQVRLTTQPTSSFLRRRWQSSGLLNRKKGRGVMVGMKTTGVDYLCLGSSRFPVVEPCLWLKIPICLTWKTCSLCSQIVLEIKYFCYSLCTDQCPRS